MNIHEEIEVYKKHFRILINWDIKFEDDGVYYGQCCAVKETRKAAIYPYDKYIKTPDDYIFHEIIHICMKEIRIGVYKERREKEELYIQDLCKLIK